MAKYFIDTEFIEGFHKPLFGKRRHFIDLISIGIYCEDGISYYAISNEFNPKDADDWVRQNVLDKIEAELFQKQPTFAKSHFNFSFKKLLKHYGKSNKQIANEVVSFIYPNAIYNHPNCLPSQMGNRMSTLPEFYGYYSDYDWVLFCSLFGKMVDLPIGFPMYCRDLKQELDVKLTQELPINGTSITPLHSKLDPKYIVEIRVLKTLSEKLDYIEKCVPQYPKQTNEHNALADAKWNYELYNFLKTI